MSTDRTLSERMRDATDRCEETRSICAADDAMIAALSERVDELEALLERAQSTIAGLENMRRLMLELAAGKGIEE
jgi:hypothetical protein